jgi:hypothetical protein
VKRTKIILHLLTVLTLISAIGLGAMAALSLICCGRASSSVQGYLYANLALGAVLTAILLQLTVIVLKIRNGQDVKREKWVVVFIVGVLVIGASGAIGTRLVTQLIGYEFAGQVWLIFPALLALAVVFLAGRVRSG